MNREAKPQALQGGVARVAEESAPALREVEESPRPPWRGPRWKEPSRSLSIDERETAIMAAQKALRRWVPNAERRAEAVLGEGVAQSGVVAAVAAVGEMLGASPSRSTRASDTSNFVYDASPDASATCSPVLLWTGERCDHSPVMASPLTLQTAVVLSYPHGPAESPMMSVAISTRSPTSSAASIAQARGVTSAASAVNEAWAAVTSPGARAAATCAALEGLAGLSDTGMVASEGEVQAALAEESRLLAEATAVLLQSMRHGGRNSSMVEVLSRSIAQQALQRLEGERGSGLSRATVLQAVRRDKELRRLLGLPAAGRHGGSSGQARAVGEVELAQLEQLLRGTDADDSTLLSPSEFEAFIGELVQAYVYTYHIYIYCVLLWGDVCRRVAPATHSEPIESESVSESVSAQESPVTAAPSTLHPLPATLHRRLPSTPRRLSRLHRRSTYSSLQRPRPWHRPSGWKAHRRRCHRLRRHWLRRLLP